ncbi:hypothetical protein KZO83_04500 [Chromohalobacter sp. TMW 2.2308]|uniref:hypothetical protein n=1 Tax=Chromohalobacter TaxID=42054 RepID=UPI001FFD931D|nr:MULTISPECIES: hypothetical protein [Chromohalobacter]MCK2041947.1 hypothetical protein [Chromohalobacter moromii]MCT8514095.1 hypothetical protein [Chromohalobacter sp. TMW 2.2271]
MAKKPYQKLDDIPAHVFSNRMLTETPSPELREYLRYMLDHHPDDLYYLYQHSQKYKHHGGGWHMDFKRWRGKLDNDLTKQGA